MLISLIRTVLLYTVLIVVIRLMGKRQIGEMEPSEFVVTMLIADLAAIPMQNNAISLFSGLVPIGAVLALELVMAAACMKLTWMRKLLCSKPVILIEDGKILLGSLKKTRVNLDELSGQLREQGVLDISTVKYAILETNGKISAFPYAKFQPATAMDAGIKASEEPMPFTIISDGQIMDDNLRRCGKTRAWLDGFLKEHKCTPAQVLLLTTSRDNALYLCRKEDAHE